MSQQKGQDPLRGPVPTMNAWEVLDKTLFYPQCIRSVRHEVLIDTVVNNFRRGVKDSSSYKACYWAAEMDLSGWSELLWSEMFDLSFSDVGLVSPMTACHLNDFYEMWLRYLRKENSDISSSHQSRSSKRILLTCVSYLCGVWKNRTVAHCSLSLMSAHVGGLIEQDWRSKLSVGKSTINSMRIIKKGHIPSVRKCIDNLALALMRSDECASVRFADLIVLWGKYTIIWRVLGVSMKQVHQKRLKGYYNWFVPFYGKYKKICDRLVAPGQHDKYLKGGHLLLNSSLYQNYNLYSADEFAEYWPFGKNSVKTNGRRVCYVRRCVIHTMMLYCRGQPVSTDERTPLEFSKEDVEIDHFYSPHMKKLKPEEMAIDWNIRDSLKETKNDFRKWWVLADEVKMIMDVPNNWAESAFLGSLEEERLHGKRASEEFMCYRYVNSDAFYQGLLDEKRPVEELPNCFNAFHINEIYEKESAGDMDFEGMVDAMASTLPPVEIMTSEEASIKRFNIRESVRHTTECNELSGILDQIRNTGDTLSTHVGSPKKKRRLMHSGGIGSSSVDDAVPTISNDFSWDVGQDNPPLIQEKSGFIYTMPMVDKVRFAELLCIPYIRDIVYSKAANLPMYKLSRKGNQRYAAYIISKDKKKRGKILGRKDSSDGNDRYTMFYASDYLSKFGRRKDMYDDSCSEEEGETCNTKERERKDALELSLLFEVLLAAILMKDRLFPTNLGDCSSELSPESFGVLRTPQKEGEEIRCSCFWDYTMLYRRMDNENEEAPKWGTSLEKLYKKHNYALIEEIMKWRDRVIKYEHSLKKLFSRICSDKRGEGKKIVTYSELLDRVDRMTRSIMKTKCISLRLKPTWSHIVEKIFCS